MRMKWVGVETITAQNWSRIEQQQRKGASAAVCKARLLGLGLLEKSGRREIEEMTV